MGIGHIGMAQMVGALILFFTPFTTASSQDLADSVRDSYNRILASRNRGLRDLSTYNNLLVHLDSEVQDFKPLLLTAQEIERVETRTAVTAILEAQFDRWRNLQSVPVQHEFESKAEYEERITASRNERDRIWQEMVSQLTPIVESSQNQATEEVKDTYEAVGHLLSQEVILSDDRVSLVLGRYETEYGRFPMTLLIIGFGNYVTSLPCSIEMGQTIRALGASFKPKVFCRLSESPVDPCSSDGPFGPLFLTPRGVRFADPRNILPSANELIVSLDCDMLERDDENIRY